MMLSSIVKEREIAMTCLLASLIQIAANASNRGRTLRVLHVYVQRKVYVSVSSVGRFPFRDVPYDNISGEGRSHDQSRTSEKSTEIKVQK
jgi:hypothetical protein